MRKAFIRRNSLFLMCWTMLAVLPAAGQAQRYVFSGEELTLMIEVWDEDLVHFYYRPATDPPTDTIPYTAQVARRDYPAPATLRREGNRVETDQFRLDVNPRTLAVRFRDGEGLLTTLTPYYRDDTLRGVRATRPAEFRAYGLGQEFQQPGSTVFDYAGGRRVGEEYGNKMLHFNEGLNGNTQIPVLYALHDSGTRNYALFFDNVYRHAWDFTNADAWAVSTADGPITGFLLAGPDLPALRRRYVDLTGRPPVPPRAMFGLWVSEYGYDDWAELEDKLRTLRENDFPVDGFVLDLQWFGNIVSESPDSRIGRLAWDTAAFPDARQKLTELREQHGVGVMLIEEAYVGRNLPEFDAYDAAGALVRAPVDTLPDSLESFILKEKWWGSGGMIDYTDPQAGAYIFRRKRLPLIEDGVVGHWTDLGEPENFNPAARYHGGAHADIHNLFNLYWVKSIYEGYQAADLTQRPFVLTRSGAAGVQRYGVALWSGDIAARLTSLAPHLANQANLSLSGVDYYGADIGGFHRNLDSNATLADLYTRWYAYGMLFDVPGRPHTVNLPTAPNPEPEQPIETAPDRVGDLTSNLANTRLRYALIPYVYSLAHAAYERGEAVMPPPVYHYQRDTSLHRLGDLKMIGPSLLNAVVTAYETDSQDVYLPAGVWYDWHAGTRHVSKGEQLPGVPLYRDGAFQLPLFAKAGAIVPLMHVDDQTMNAFGRRRDGTRRDELLLRVYGGAEGAFTLTEDDGRTVAYQRGEVRQTPLRYVPGTSGNTIVIGAATGRYRPDERRDNYVTLFSPRRLRSVTLNGRRIRQFGAVAELEAISGPGWVELPDGQWLLRTGTMPVGREKKFELRLR